MTLHLFNGGSSASARANFYLDNGWFFNGQINFADQAQTARPSIIDGSGISVTFLEPEASFSPTDGRKQTLLCMTCYHYINQNGVDVVTCLYVLQRVTLRRGGGNARHTFTALDSSVRTFYKSFSWLTDYDLLYWRTIEMASHLMTGMPPPSYTVTVFSWLSAHPSPDSAGASRTWGDLWVADTAICDSIFVNWRRTSNAGLPISWTYSLLHQV